MQNKYIKEVDSVVKHK